MNVATETARMNGARVLPKVPGLNAQPLGPSIGTDHWRTNRQGIVRRNSQIRQARPCAGAGDWNLVPGKRATKKQAEKISDRPERRQNIAKAPKRIRKAS